MNRHAFPVLLGALALLLVVLVGRDRVSTAEDKRPDHTVFLHITGEGPSAKAWYRGGPPTGVPVQDALDTFSEQGYRVVSVSPSSRPSVTTVVTSAGASTRDSVGEQFFIVFLER